MSQSGWGNTSTSFNVMCWGSPCVMHCLLTACFNSFDDRPGLLCTFCMRVVGNAHLTSSGLMHLIMSAARSPSIASLRYVRCASMSCLWWGIFLGKVASGGIWMWCLAPGIGSTSQTDKVKQFHYCWDKSNSFYCKCHKGEVYITQENFMHSVKVKIHVNVWLKSCKSQTLLQLNFFPILKLLPDWTLTVDVKL